jgi:hypothetical protein
MALAGVIWEEGILIEEMSPQDWPVDKSVGNFLDELLMWESQVHCAHGPFWIGGLMVLDEAQENSSMAPASVPAMTSLETVLQAVCWNKPTPLLWSQCFIAIETLTKTPGHERNLLCAGFILSYAASCLFLRAYQILASCPKFWLLKI